MMVVRVGLSNVSKCVLSKYLWLNGKKVGREIKKEEGKVRKLTYILIANMLSLQHMYTVKYTRGGVY